MELLKRSLARKSESPIAESESEISIDRVLELVLWFGSVVGGVVGLHNNNFLGI